jgi:hypothetical protein
MGFEPMRYPNTVEPRLTATRLIRPPRLGLDEMPIHFLKTATFFVSRLTNFHTC